MKGIAREWILLESHHVLQHFMQQNQPATYGVQWPEKRLYDWKHPLVWGRRSTIGSSIHLEETTNLVKLISKPRTALAPKEHRKILLDVLPPPHKVFRLPPHIYGDRNAQQVQQVDDLGRSEAVCACRSTPSFIHKTKWMLCWKRCTFHHHVKPTVRTASSLPEVLIRSQAVILSANGPLLQQGNMPAAAPVDAITCKRG